MKMAKLCALLTGTSRRLMWPTRSRLSAPIKRRRSGRPSSSACSPCVASRWGFCGLMAVWKAAVLCAAEYVALIIRG